MLTSKICLNDEKLRICDALKGCVDLDNFFLWKIVIIGVTTHVRKQEIFQFFQTNMHSLS